MPIEEIANKLASVIGTGEVVEMAYLGGSKPGAVRKVVVLGINGDKIRAREVGSRVSKEFFIAKIVYPLDPNNLPEVKKVEHFKTFEEVFERYKDDFQKWGYTPQLEENGVLLFESFKNGNLRKTPSASLVYEEFTTEFCIDMETGEEVEITKPRKLHFVVRFKKQKSHSFGSLDRAVQYFVANLKE